MSKAKVPDDLVLESATIPPGTIPHEHKLIRSANHAVPMDESSDCPMRTKWLEELQAKYKAKYGRCCP